MLSPCDDRNDCIVDICGGNGQPNVCGRTPVADGGMPNRCDGGTTTISGTVLAPTNAANGYGQPDPIPGALIYVPNAPVASLDGA